LGALFTTGSILAAFLAGAVALFSPCCIVFLFPAYLAAAVKNRRWKLLPLSLVFAAGIAIVLVPVTLGVALLSSVFARYHVILYVAGGLLLLALAALALSGRTWSMPSFVRAPSVERSDTAGVFALGVFSGVASSCCAPVLAGVMALSALSGSLIGSTGLGLTYVFGMVFPLFLTALLWDRLRLGERRLFQAKPIEIRALGTTLRTNTVNLAVAIAFAAMGVFVLFLAVAGNPTFTPATQLGFGRWLSSVFAGLIRFLDPVPEPILGLALLGLAATFVLLGVRGRRADLEAQGGHCHVNEQDGVEAPDAQAPAVDDPVSVEGSRQTIHR